VGTMWNDRHLRAHAVTELFGASGDKEDAIAVVGERTAKPDGSTYWNGFDPHVPHRC
jgi:hypothetical protein